MNNFKTFFFAILVALLLTACSDELAGQARQAANQITEAAKKMASQKIDEAKNQTIEQINKVGKEPVAPKEGEEKDKSISAEKSKSDS